MENLASQVGLQTSSLAHALQTNAYQFEFHAIIKVLESLNQGAAPLGVTPTPQLEPVRFRTYVSQKYPSTQVIAFDPYALPDGPPLLTTNIMSIAGIQGPLPTPYTELIIHRDQKKDRGLHNFIDIFNHRLLSIFHRIRKKYWVSLAAERPENTMLGSCSRNLVGLGFPGLQNRLLVPDRSLLYYAGFFWTRTRSALCLQTLLSTYFNLPVEIQQFQGAWRSIPASQLTRIGKGGQNNRVGISAGLSPRFWDNTAGVFLKIGPLSLDNYLSFLNPQPAFQIMHQLIGLYTNNHFSYKCNLLIPTSSIPQMRLGQSMHLGWTTWINRYSPAPPTIDSQTILSSSPLYTPPYLRS